MTTPNEHERMVELQKYIHDALPCGDNAERHFTAQLIVKHVSCMFTTLITKVREEEIKRMLQYSHIGYEFIEGVRQYADERGITNTNK